MKIYKASNIAMKKMVDSTPSVTSCFNTTLLKNGIKLNRIYYCNLKTSFPNKVNEAFSKTYDLGGQKDLCSMEYMDKLQSFEKNIYGTTFDKGLIIVNDMVVGMISENLKYCRHLSFENINDLNDLMKFLDMILFNLGVLEEQGISYSPLSTYEGASGPFTNFLYTNIHSYLDIKFANFGGSDFGFDDDFNPEKMYQEYILLLKRLIDKIAFQYQDVMEFLSEINYQNINKYQEAVEINQKIKKLSSK